MELDYDQEYYDAFEFGERERTRKPSAKAKSVAVTESEEDVAPTGPLASFFEAEWIVGEPAVVKSGKEATVYCCESHPRFDKGLLAAKTYRPRLQRNFKNDSIYQQGRTTLDARADRAIARRTATGIAMQSAMWIRSEYETLRRLHAAGADVPEPIAQAESAILMEYFGAPGMAAPQLQNVRLAPDEAAPLFGQLLDNLVIFLDEDRVHGDLSAFNVLYWQGKLQIIDFPQAVDPMDNPDAYALFARDLHRIYAYFEPYGIRCDTRRLARRLWIECGRPAPSVHDEQAL